jgi:HNH endonuclease
MKLAIMPNGCLEWMKGHDKFGYGFIHHNGGYMRTHRFIWELINGPIPEGMCVCHTCDNPPCCNIEHLFLGTNADNTADKMAKGRHSNGRAERTHCPQGHPYDEANTISVRGGQCRRCRLCLNAMRRRRRAILKAQAA